MRPKCAFMVFGQQPDGYFVPRERRILASLSWKKIFSFIRGRGGAKNEFNSKNLLIAFYGQITFYSPR